MKRAVLQPLILGAFIGTVVTSIFRLAMPSHLPLQAKVLSLVDIAAQKTEGKHPRANFFITTLRPFLQRICSDQNLSFTEVFLLRSLVEEWWDADASSCATFLSDIGKVGECLLTECLHTKIDSQDGSIPNIMSIVRNIDDNGCREPLLSAIVGRIAKTDPIQALDLVESLPRALQKPMQAQIADSWIRADGPSALRYLVANGAIDFSVIRSACELAAEFDAERNFEALLSIPAEDFGKRPRFSKMNALQQFFLEVRKKNPKEAASMLARLPASDFQSNNVTYLTAELIANGGSQDDLGNLSEKRRADVFKMASLLIAAKDLPKAAELIERIQGEAAKIEAYASIAAKGAEKTPEQTLEWAAGISDPLSRSAAVSAAFQTWLMEKPAKAIVSALTEMQTNQSDLARLARLQVVDFAYEATPEQTKEIKNQFKNLNPSVRSMLESAVTLKFDNETAARIRSLLK